MQFSVSRFLRNKLDPLNIENEYHLAPTSKKLLLLGEMIGTKETEEFVSVSGIYIVILTLKNNSLLRTS